MNAGNLMKFQWSCPWMEQKLGECRESDEVSKEFSLDGTEIG